MSKGLKTAFSAMSAVVAAVFAALFFITGCTAIDCSNSGSAEFPEQERWWK